MNKAPTIEDFLQGNHYPKRVKKPKAKVKKRRRKSKKTITRDNTVNFSQDVKDKIWRRDGGACVRCRSELQLCFDHKYHICKMAKR